MNDRPCLKDSKLICDDCTGKPITCMVRIGEDAGLYERVPLDIDLKRTDPNE